MEMEMDRNWKLLLRRAHPCQFVNASVFRPLSVAMRVKDHTGDLYSALGTNRHDFDQGEKNGIYKWKLRAR